MISTPDQPLPSDAIDRLQKARQEILDQLSKAIVGQQEVIDNC